MAVLVQLAMSHIYVLVTDSKLQIPPTHRPWFELRLSITRNGSRLQMSLGVNVQKSEKNNMWKYMRN
jgi:hypothetical protein